MRKTITTILIACGLPVLADVPAQYAQVNPAGEWQAAISQARVTIADLMNTGAPGVSVAVAVDGDIVWAEGFGYADVENSVPVTPLTKFRIGSVSKAMTAIAMAQALEQGSLQLDVPIQNYLSTFPKKEKGIVTTKWLASHRAGVRGYLEDMSDNFIQDHYEEVSDALAIFSDDPLLHEPGTAYFYSSHGFNLLSAVIEAAVETPFLDIMRTQVWGPMRLLNTMADHTDYIITHRAAPYLRNSAGQLVNAPFVDNSYKWAGGGFLSTPSDVVRFGFGVLDDGLISRASFNLLTTPPLDQGGEPAEQSYGLGWALFGDGWVGHMGGSVGGTTLFHIHPEKRVAVAITCNLSSCFPKDLDLTAIRDAFVAD